MSTVTEGPNDLLLDEVESLEAIMMTDLIVTRNAQTGFPEIVESTLFPVVEDDCEQYVCVTLQVLPTPGYPHEAPNYKLLRPRGLDDDRLENIKKACNAKLQDSIGFPVIYDLMEMIREQLTGSNLPSGTCVICLYGFVDGDEFTRTECYHYLHSYCLARHLNAMRRNYQEEYDKLPAWLQKTADPFKATCPVCREPIRDETDSLKCAMPPSELQNAPDFELTDELRELQERMTRLYLQQKSRGGIIDEEADSAPVISIETEAEVRRRLQRKQEQEEAANATGGEGSNSSNSGKNSPNGSAEKSNGIGADGAEGGAGAGASVESRSTMVADGKNGDAVKTAKPFSNFNPVPGPPNLRLVPEPSNNNYDPHQYNRRHYRGGRRHNQHHHHHHRDRERDREREQRHEVNHSTAAGQANATASAADAAAATPAAPNAVGAGGGAGSGSVGKAHQSGEEAASEACGNLRRY